MQPGRAASSQRSAAERGSGMSTADGLPALAEHIPRKALPGAAAQEWAPAAGRAPSWDGCTEGPLSWLAVGRGLGSPIPFLVGWVWWVSLLEGKLCWKWLMQVPTNALRAVVTKKSILVVC